jgi:hypothetical protein
VFFPATSAKGWRQQQFILSPISTRHVGKSSIKTVPSISSEDSLETLKMAYKNNDPFCRIARFIIVFKDVGLSFRSFLNAVGENGV